MHFHRNVIKYCVLLSPAMLLQIGCSRSTYGVHKMFLSNKELLEEIKAIREKMSLKEVPDTHGHESMEVGIIAEHAHTCSMCNTPYKHTHLKKPLGFCDYRHLCPQCIEETGLPTCIEPKKQ